MRQPRFERRPGEKIRAYVARIDEAVADCGVIRGGRSEAGVRRDLHALHRMIQVLPCGAMTLFPEGNPIPGRHGGRGATGSGAANSCDSAASDSRRRKLNVAAVKQKGQAPGHLAK